MDWNDQIRSSERVLLIFLHDLILDFQIFPKPH